MKSRSLLLAAGLLGLTGVALGAFGAHALRDRLMMEGTRSAWDTAVHYHLLHAATVFGAAIWARHGGSGHVARKLGWAAGCWIIGVGLFSGSLYLLALGGPRWLGPITPLGGVAFLAGWACVAVAGLGNEDAA